MEQRSVRAIGFVLGVGALALIVGGLSMLVRSETFAEWREEWGSDYSREAGAIGALRTLTTAQALFREGDKDHNGILDYAPSLAAIGRCSLIDPKLASGTKRGYTFRILRADPFTWSATASPRRSGERYFFVDESGVIRFSMGSMPTSMSTAIGG